MSISGETMKLDHINIHTNDIEGVKDAFVRFLCLNVGDRPPFKSQGYWLYGEEHPIVHLTKTDRKPGNSTGALDHVAFKDDDFDGLISRLVQDGIEYDQRVVPVSGGRQIFFKINHEIMVEVDFNPAS